MSKKIKIILCSMIILCLFGCVRNKTDDKLVDHYDKLGQSMKNYYDEDDLPTYEGKYVEVKVKNVIKYHYDYTGEDIYIYDLIIAPIYNQKTILSGLKLSSIDYGNDLKKFYYDVNSSYEKLIKSNYTYNNIQDILANEFQFFLEDSSKIFNYTITDEQFKSGVSNICLTVTINGYKDKVYLTDLIISDYDEQFDNNEIIKSIKEKGNLKLSLHAYIDFDK